MHLHDEVVLIGEEIVENLLNRAQNDKEIQQKLYVLGAMIGQGIRSGTGIGGGGKPGKFNIGDIIAGFLLPKITGGEQQQQRESNIGL